MSKKTNKLMGKTLHYAVILIFTALVLWGVGAVMRESDQASIIDGAVQLARDGALVGREFYNYDLLFGSYWLVAIFYKLFGLDAAGSSLDQLVTVGNWVAAVVFLSGLVTATLSIGKPKWWGLLILVVCLFSPVFLYSAPLLSPAIISAGFLLALCVAFEKSRSLGGDLLIGCLAFGAVAARADAVLAMPLLACLSAKEPLITRILKSRRVWAAALGSVIALLLGSLIYPLAQHQPKRFFDALLFGAYTVFGLNGAVFIVAAFFFILIKKVIKERTLFYALLCVSFVFPIVYYSTAFFSPRYLIITVVLLLSTLVFKQGRNLWEEFIISKWGKVVLGISILHTVGALFVGVHFSSMKSFSLTSSESTLFPTADGLWPMGANLAFYQQLREGNKIPVDHNQKVWSAWKSIDPVSLPPESDVSVRSNGFVSFAKLWLRVMGKSYTKEVQEDPIILMDGRSVVKTNKSHNPGIRDDSKWLIFHAQKIGFAFNERVGEGVYLLSNSEQSSNPQWEVLKTLRSYTHGNDYVTMKPESVVEKDLLQISYRWIIMVPHRSREDFSAWLLQNINEQATQLKREDDGTTETMDVYSFVAKNKRDVLRLLDLSSDIWIARSALPVFMSKTH